MMMFSSWVDRWCLANFSILAQNVYLLHGDDQFVSKIDTLSYSTPWPIIWLLTRYSPKHIFNTRAPPEEIKIHKDFLAFENKIKWKYVFRNADPTQRRFPIKKPPKSCYAVVAIELTAWSGELRKAVLGLTRDAQKWFKNHKPPRDTLQQFAFRQFDRSELVAIPTDKDGGFTILQSSRRIAELKSLMGGTTYREVSRVMEIDPHKIRSQYYRLCAKISHHEDEQGLYSALVSSWSEQHLTAQIMLNCKSHKDPIEFRNIHSAPKSAFNGLSSYFDKKLGQKLKTLPHLVRDS
jgi:hypothetical protein